MHLIHLDRYLPNLRNLSLQGNALKTWRDLDPIGARRDKMKHLRELVLIGTPLRDMEYKNGRGDRYRRCESVTIISSIMLISLPAKSLDASSHWKSWTQWQSLKSALQMIRRQDQHQKYRSPVRQHFRSRWDHPSLQAWTVSLLAISCFGECLVSLHFA